MREIAVRGGHARPLWAGHPWVHAEAAIEQGDPDGDVARVVDTQGRLIGWGLVSDSSALRVRLLGRGDVPDDVDALLSERILDAARLRERLFPASGETDVYRLVHAEGDGLPGLIVDRFADVLVAVFATRPMHRRREQLSRVLMKASGTRALVARPGAFDAEEGIAASAFPYAVGAEVTDTVRVQEAGMALDVDVLHGQKTGHYADQRENRLHVAALSRDAEMLDLYAGTGGFSIQALRGHARSSLAVDASERVLETARATATHAGVDAALQTRVSDVRAILRELKEAERTFDVVVLDPPNFFPRRGGSGQALKAYRDLNVQALTRVRPGGVLATFTCSGRLRPGAFFDIVRSAARECRRPLRVLRELAAGPDHPVLAAAPEGRYLTGWLIVVGA